MNDVFLTNQTIIINYLAEEHNPVGLYGGHVMCSVRGAEWIYIYSSDASQYSDR
jgi:hypothetical protein